MCAGLWAIASRCSCAVPGVRIASLLQPVVEACEKGEAGDVRVEVLVKPKAEDGAGQVCT